MNIIAIIAVLPLAFTFSACARPLNTSAEQPALSRRVIAADDARFLYEGRFDKSVSSAPVVIWQGSRISLDFEGGSLAFLFGNAAGQNFFNAVVDGKNAVIAVKAGAAGRVEYPGELSAGRHRLTLFKRSEASAGTAVFLGVELAPGKQAWRPAAPRYKLAMQFFGDSITAGACSEDGAADQWENRATHNNAVSYGALTADAFVADYRNISISGMGISAGYVETKAGQAWDRVYPYAASPRAGFNDWTPDVVFINYGENDDSFTNGKNLPFPADFADGYVALVKAIRGDYPSAKVVLLRGAMYGGSQSQELREAWEEAVTRLQVFDPGITYFVFKHWSSNHPRVADHKALAEELTLWLKRQEFMKPYL